MPSWVVITLVNACCLSTVRTPTDRTGPGAATGLQYRRGHVVGQKITLGRIRARKTVLSTSSDYPDRALRRRPSRLPPHQ